MKWNPIQHNFLKPMTDVTDTLFNRNRSQCKRYKLIPEVHSQNFIYDPIIYRNKSFWQKNNYIYKKLYNYNNSKFGWHIFETGFFV